MIALDAVVYRAQNGRFWLMVLLQRARACPGVARAVITPGHDQNLRGLWTLRPLWFAAARARQPRAASVNAPLTADSMTGAAVAWLMGRAGFSASTATT